MSLKSVFALFFHPYLCHAGIDAGLEVNAEKTTT